MQWKDPGARYVFPRPSAATCALVIGTRQVEDIYDVPVWRQKAYPARCVADHLSANAFPRWPGVSAHIALVQTPAGPAWPILYWQYNPTGKPVLSPVIRFFQHDTIVWSTV